VVAKRPPLLTPGPTICYSLLQQPTSRLSTGDTSAELFEEEFNVEGESKKGMGWQFCETVVVSYVNEQSTIVYYTVRVAARNVRLQWTVL
jgi:hypothetical protein